MIRALRFDASGVTEADPAAASAARADGEWVWIDLIGAGDADIHRICGAFGFAHYAVEDVLVETGSPKIDDYGDHTFVVLHGVADDTTRLRTIEYDAFIGPDYLVTVRREDLPGFAWMWDQLLGGLQVPDGPDRLFGRLTEFDGARFEDLADALEVHIDGLEDRALAGDPEVVAEVQGLRRDAVRLRRVLGPQRTAVGELARDDFPAVAERARMRLGSALDRYDRASESLEASRILLGTVLDTYRAAVAERANEVMKVLTVFAAIMMPLTFMAGIYGMNFANMPELGWRWSYPIAIGAMLTVGIGLWTYFTRRGFIGGPRLSRIPGVVGRGLGGLVRLTTRPIVLAGHLVTQHGRDDPPSDS